MIVGVVCEDELNMSRVQHFADLFELGVVQAAGIPRPYRNLVQIELVRREMERLLEAPSTSP